MRCASSAKGVWGSPPDREAAKNVLRHAVASGVNFIDTADSYGPNTSEELIAEALAPYPAGLIIATKGGLVRPGPGNWDVRRPAGASCARRCEGSLRRLRLERIDLYQFHRPDPKVPLRRVDRRARRAAAGGEDPPHRRFERHGRAARGGARDRADRLGAEPLQFEDRSSEEVLDACERDGLAFLPWAPIGGTSRLKAQMLERLAHEHGATPLQIALAWLLKRSPVVLPIPGTGSSAHLDSNLAAAALHLSEAEFRALNDA